jgi:hypothetical protein
VKAPLDWEVAKTLTLVCLPLIQLRATGVEVFVLALVRVTVCRGIPVIPQFCDLYHNIWCLSNDFIH